MRLLTRLAAVAALLVASGPAHAATRPVLGVYSEEELGGAASERDAAAHLQHAAGFGYIRMPLSWKLVEPSPGFRDWTRIDQAIETAARYDITVLPFVLDAPSWASGAAPGATGVHPPQNMNDYAAFLAACVARYGPNGTFWVERPWLVTRFIRAWQVWNEPNLSIFWKPQPNPAGYVAMLRAARTAIKSVDPGAHVLMAGLPDSRIGVPIKTFLNQFYAAGGRGTFDALAVNAYAPDAAGVLAVVDGARRVAAAHGDRDLPTWVTEFGYASGGESSFVTTDEAGQARLAALAAFALREVADEWNLGGIFYFQWRDQARPAAARDIWPFHAGLLRVDGSAKPALGAVAAALGIPLGSPSGLKGRRQSLKVRLEVLSRRRDATSRGPLVHLRCSRPCQANLTLLALDPRPGQGALRHTSGRWKRELPHSRYVRTRLRLNARERRWLAGHPRAALTIIATALTDSGGLARTEKPVRRR